MPRPGLLLGVLFIPLLAAGQPAPGVWTVLPNTPNIGIRHEDIFFPSRETGWIVGFGGVFKTTDGGATWREQRIDGTAFRSTGFADTETGWIGSLNRGHILYETHDGGATWRDITDRISGPLPEGICGLWVVNASLIYGVGRYNGPAHLVKSTDGGQTWISKDMSAYARTLIDVFFFDETTGIAVGGTDPALNGHAVVLRTTDGGETWTVRHTSSQPAEWGWKISFPTSSTGYVSVESNERAKVLKTTDGGLTWTERPIPGNERLQAVGFVTEDLGWVGGRGVTAVTEDGGTAWAEADFGERLNRIRRLGDSLAYAIGTQAFLYRIATPTGRERPELPAPAVVLDQNYPNPFRPETTIAYTLEAPAAVTLSVYDLLGRHVTTLVEGMQGAGRHEAVWDGTNEAGTRVGPGVYLYRLMAGTQTRARRLLVR